MSHEAAFAGMDNRENRDIDRETWLDARLRRAHDGVIEAPLPEPIATLLRRLAEKTAPAESGRDGARIGRDPTKESRNGEHP